MPVRQQYMSKNPNKMHADCVTWVIFITVVAFILIDIHKCAFGSALRLSWGHHLYILTMRTSAS